MRYSWISLVSPVLLVVYSSGYADDSHWRMLKKVLQDDVQIVSEDDTRMTLFHRVYRDTVRIGLDPCDECDITGVMEIKRGGNPYRAWIAHEKFWNNPDRPRTIWGEYFRSSFLRILRPPSKS